MRASRSLIPKKYRNLHRQSFKVGFEVECVFFRTKIPHDKLEELLHKIHPQIILGDDCSIEEQHDFDDPLITDRDIRHQFSAEIETPPLHPFESLIVLRLIFQLVKKYGYTNDSCGLHASFSPVNDDVYYSVNPLVIFNQALWAKIKKDFGRTHNGYCSTTPWNKDGISQNEEKKLLDPFQYWCDVLRCGRDYYRYGYGADDGVHASYDGHSSEVNFDNYGEIRRPRSRIEIRCMGGEDYHKKFPLVTQYVDRIITAFRKGYTKKFA
jgi:hypothetical protein